MCIYIKKAFEVIIFFYIRYVPRIYMCVCVYVK